jgi:hypothetical protein
MSIIIGEIAWERQRLSDGCYLLPSSFKAKAGWARACLNHWRDNDIILKHPAQWGIVASGLMVVHILDDGEPYERGILERVRRGELFFSHGLDSSPVQTRAAIAANEWRAAKSPPERQNRPLEGERIGHVSYVPLANFPQSPLRVLDDELAELSQNVAKIAQGGY